MKKIDSDLVPSTLNILSGLPYFLSAKEEHDFVFSITLTLKRKVNGDALIKAVNLASKRYPYLLVRCAKSFTGIRLVRTDEPIAVLETSGWIPLNSEKSHHYLIAVSYSEKKIRFEFFRGLCTDKGFYYFLKTVVYYYFTIHTQSEQKIEGVRLTDTPMDPKEFFDPFSEPLPQSEKKQPASSKAPKALKLSELGLVKRSQVQVRRLIMSESELSRYMKSVGGNEKSVMTLAMFEVLNTIHFTEKQPIVARVYGDSSRLLRASTSNISPHVLTDITYTDELKEASPEEKNRVIRKKLKYFSDYDDVYPILFANQSLAQLVHRIPVLAIGQTMMKSWHKKHCSLSTFYVNYETVPEFGTCDSYIESFLIEPYLCECELLIDVRLDHGNYVISLYQCWKEDIYFDGFCNKLTELGLKYQIQYQGPLEIFQEETDSDVAS